MRFPRLPSRLVFWRRAACLGELYWGDLDHYGDGGPRIAEHSRGALLLVVHTHLASITVCIDHIPDRVEKNWPVFQVAKQSVEDEKFIEWVRLPHKMTFVLSRTTNVQRDQLGSYIGKISDRALKKLKQAYRDQRTGT